MHTNLILIQESYSIKCMYVNVFYEMTFYVSYSYKGGGKALSIAAYNGHVECLAALLSAGADLNIPDNVSIHLMLNLSSYTN